MKTALVTGATSGIGRESAKGLIDKGFFVIGTSRSDEKEQEAKKYLGDNSIIIRAEMSSQESLRNLANKVKEHLNGRGLDVLINNAGSFYSYYSLSPEGVEKQFAINAIAPLYLSLLLYNDIVKAKGRIINVNSSSHYGARIRWRDIQLSQSYGQLKAYKQSKLVSVMLAAKFNMLSDNVKMYMADPGLVATDIGYKNTGVLAKAVWKMRKKSGQSAEHGAQTSIYLASKDELPDELYFKDCKPQKPNKMVQNSDHLDRIWDYCMGIAAMDEREIFK